MFKPLVLFKKFKPLVILFKYLIIFIFGDLVLFKYTDEPIFYFAVVIGLLAIGFLMQHFNKARKKHQSKRSRWFDRAKSQKVSIKFDRRISAENEDIQMLWKFVSGDISTHEFENWLYNNGTLESLLGKDFYLEAISTDFRPSARQVFSLKKKLKEFLLKTHPIDCDCITLRDINLFDADDDYDGELSPVESFLSSLETAKRPEGRWWLSLELCKKVWSILVIGSG